MMRLASIAIAATLTLIAVACTDDAASRPAPSSTGAEGPVTASPTADPPETIDAAGLRVPETGPVTIELPQLVGLTEQDARAWADASGFTSVLRPGELGPGNLDYTRLTLAIDASGIVTRAFAG